MNSKSPPGPVVIVTGMSGAGKSSALRALEDAGYEAVDNLPLSLLAGLARPEQGFEGKLAIGVDTRTRGFAPDTLLAALERLTNGGTGPTLLFLDCDDEVLRRRFTETRRPHPLAGDRPVRVGIRQERDLLVPVRARADIVIDTGEFRPADLKKALEHHFGEGRSVRPAIFVTSFAFRYGLPRDADLVFDVRFLRNPHYIDGLRPLTGVDQAVDDYVVADPDFGSFFSSLTGMLLPLLPRYDAEGKSYLTIAVGCTGGRHRSVCVAARLVDRLREEGYPASLHHRDMNRLG